MNLQQLVTFSTVLNEGSMTAAAEKLFLTQPAVSQQIRNLEDELGVNLLVRGTRQAKPTLQGQILYEYSRKIIMLTQQAEVAIQTIGAHVEGNLRIGTVNSLGLYMIGPVVGLFLKHNHKLKIKLNYAGGEEIIQAFNKGELDIAILPDVEKEFDRSLVVCEKQFLVKDEIWLAASGKSAQLPHSIKLESIMSRPFVAFESGYPTFERLLKNKLKSAQVPYEPVFESTNVGTLKRVIESGLGWGFLPSHSIQKQVKAGRLVAVDVDGLSHSVPIYLYANKKSDPKTVDIFYRALKQHLSSS